ncbi:MAG: hypothetical protein ACJAT1_002301 [Marivirga sp.]|jgi:hypothetical protein
MSLKPYSSISIYYHGQKLFEAYYHQIFQTYKWICVFIINNNNEFFKDD